MRPIEKKIDGVGYIFLIPLILVIQVLEQGCAQRVMLRQARGDFRRCPKIKRDTVELTAWLKMRVPLAKHILCYDRLRAEMKSYIQDTGDQRTRATLVFLEHVLRRYVWPVRDGRESRLAGARRVPAPHGRVGMVCGMGEGRYGTRPADGPGEEGRKSALPVVANMGEPAHDVFWVDGGHSRLHRVVPRVLRIPKAHHPVPTGVYLFACAGHGRRL